MERTGGVVYHFGAYSFDETGLELRKHGLPIKLPGQPAALLRLLLRQAGQVVSRENFKDELWPKDTFVDFERGINAAMTRLREALLDSAKAPKYIETLARRGYRFVGAVTIEREASPSRKLRVTVLPFDCRQANEETEFLALSLPDAIETSLYETGTCLLRSSKDFGAGAFDWGTLHAKGGVDFAVTGWIVRGPRDYRVSVQLVKLPDGEIVWARTADFPLEGVFDLQRQISRDIAKRLSPAEAAIDARPQVKVSPRGYELFLRANHLSLRMRDLPMAIEMYQACLAEDPGFAAAWARLGRCHRILAKFRDGMSENASSAERAFEKAFALNPDLGGAHCEFAYLETEQGRVEAALRRLLRISPSPSWDVERFAALVHACRYAGLLEESLAAHRVARRLDAQARSTVMNTYFALGELATALAESNDKVGFLDAMILESLGRGGEALRRMGGREDLPPLVRTWFAALEAMLRGRRTKALASLRELHEEGVDPEGFYFRARLFARLDCAEDALASLRGALERGYYCAAAMKREPAFAALAGSAAFRKIAQEAARRSKEARALFGELGGTELLSGA